jgi:hypothetical protein
MASLQVMRRANASMQETASSPVTMLEKLKRWEMGMRLVAA